MTRCKAFNGIGGERVNTIIGDRPTSLSRNEIERLSISLLDLFLTHFLRYI